MAILLHFMIKSQALPGKDITKMTIKYDRIQAGDRIYIPSHRKSFCVIEKYNYEIQYYVNLAGLGNVNISCPPEWFKGSYIE